MYQPDKQNVRRDKSRVVTFCFKGWHYQCHTLDQLIHLGSVCKMVPLKWSETWLEECLRCTKSEGGRVALWSLSRNFKMAAKMSAKCELLPTYTLIVYIFFQQHTNIIKDVQMRFFHIIVITIQKHTYVNVNVFALY